MKHWSKLAAVLAVVALLAGVFAVAYAEPATQTDAPVVDTKAPTIRARRMDGLAPCRFRIGVVPALG